MTLLENSSLVFTAAIVLALAGPSLAGDLQPFIVPALIVSMTLSMREVDVGLEGVKRSSKPLLYSLLLNYVFLTGLILLSAYLLVDDPAYLMGFVVMAAIPPAVAVVPFAYLLGGDFQAAAYAQLACYGASLLTAPALTLLFLGVQVDVAALMELLFLVIILPLMLSRAAAKMKDRFFVHDRKIVNLCFFLITYSIIGLNQETLVSDTLSLAPVLLVLLLRTYGAATVIYFTHRNRVAVERNIVYTLFGSYKNGGMAAAVALTLLGSRAALPAGVSALFEMSMIVYLQRILYRKIGG